MAGERTELDALRGCMADLLRAHGLAAVEAWPGRDRQRLTGVVAAVSIRSCTAEPGAFWEYLGEELDADAGVWRERYGRRLEVVFGLDLYAPGEAGGGACQTGFDALAQALHTGTGGGLRLIALSRGEVSYDQELDVLRCPAEARCRAYLYASAEEGGAFTDFVVKGEVL